MESRKKKNLVLNCILFYQICITIYGVYAIFAGKYASAVIFLAIGIWGIISVQSAVKAARKRQKFEKKIDNIFKDLNDNL